MTCDSQGDTSITDEAFVRLLGLTGSSAHLALCVRRAIAELCRMPPEAISPAHSTQWLSKRMVYPGGTEWDLLAFELELADALGVHSNLESEDLPPFLPHRFFWWHRPGPANLGEWILGVVSVLETKQVPNG